MYHFKFYAPTKVVFGRNTEEQLTDLVREFGGKKLLIHYGGGSVIRSGLLQKVKDQLDSSGISYVSLGGAVPNPRLGLVYQGIELCRREGVDFILAVGGGSAIDSAKAIGYGAANEGDVWDFYDHKRQASACLPVGVILTFAATGSEMSDSSVITREEGLVKRGYNSDLCRPRFAIMDPELTMTLPDYQTACGCTDIMMHTMERYFTNGGNMEITDALAEGLLRTVKENALILRRDPGNYDARAEVMWAGSLSHNGLTGCGSDGGDWHLISWNMRSEVSLMWLTAPVWPRSGEAGPDMFTGTVCPASASSLSMLWEWQRPVPTKRSRSGELRLWKISIVRFICQPTYMNLGSNRQRSRWRIWRINARLAQAAQLALPES